MASTIAVDHDTQGESDHSEVLKFSGVSMNSRDWTPGASAARRACAMDVRARRHCLTVVHVAQSRRTSGKNRREDCAGGIPLKRCKVASSRPCAFNS
jgi:hypothetical protein